MLFLHVVKNPPDISLGDWYESVCKPGSVLNDHLSSPAVAGRIKPPPENSRAGLMFSRGVAPDRVYSISMSPCDEWALTSLFHPYHDNMAVSFCCTCPRVTPGGRYPLFLPYGARTFLMYRLSPCTRGRSAYSCCYFNHFDSSSQ